MRHVVSRSEVAHLWAHQAQGDAREPGGRTYFEGRTIYSYGRHFATAHILSDKCGKLAGRVVVNEDSYGNTTAKHKSEVWSAMTQQQRANSISVPELRGSDAEELERSLEERKLPKMAEALVQEVRKCVAKLAERKYDSWPYKGLLRRACEWEKSAKAIYTAVGRKYPLPELPQELPSQAEMDALILKVARKELEEMLKEHLRYVRDWAVTDTGQYNALGRVKNDCASLRAAQAIYKRLKGKPSAQIAKRLKNNLAVQQPLQEAHDKEVRETAYKVLLRELRAFARAKHDKSTYWFPRVVDAEVFVEHGVVEGHPYHDLALRYMRVSQGRNVLRNVDQVQSNIRVGDKAATAKEKLRYYEGAVGKLQDNPKWPPHLRAYMSKVLARVAEVEKNLPELRKQVAAEFLADIEKWKAGEISSLSWNAGTYARVKGDVIETNRGAIVPLVHGCRLARLYTAIVKRGGSNWVDGAGPMVGHYRVNSIGADGSLVIGCHNFDPDEAKRLYDLMVSNPACAEGATNWSIT